MNYTIVIGNKKIFSIKKIMLNEINSNNKKSN